MIVTLPILRHGESLALESRVYPCPASHPLEDVVLAVGLAYSVNSITSARIVNFGIENNRRYSEDLS